MSNQSPIVAIRDWFLSQSETVQHEIGLGVAYPLFDVPSIEIADRARCVALVAGWLDDTIARNLQLGRILSFTACLDHMLRERDTAEKWDVTEQMTKRILGKMTPDLAAEGADLLASLPARREQWIAVAADWYRLRDGIFEGRHLDTWVFKG